MTGDELRKARRQLGLTGAPFAKAFDVTVRTLRRWEVGVSPVPNNVAVLVARALKDPSLRRELGLNARKGPQGSG